MSKSVDANIKKMSEISAPFLEYIQSKFKYKGYSPVELSDSEQIMFLSLFVIGEDLYSMYDSKIQIPKQIKSNPEMKIVWETSAKQVYQQQVINRALQIFYKIEEQMKKVSTAVYEFEPDKYTTAEIITALNLAQLEGYHVNWNELDHGTSEIHEDWLCKFKKGDPINYQTLFNSTIKHCIQLGRLNSAKIKHLPMTDEIALSQIEATISL